MAAILAFVYFTSGSVFCRASAGCDGAHLVRPGLPSSGYLHYTLLVSGHKLRTRDQVTAISNVVSGLLLLRLGSDEGEEVRMSGEGVRPLLRRSGLSPAPLLLFLFLLMLLMLFMVL